MTRRVKAGQPLEDRQHRITDDVIRDDWRSGSGQCVAVNLMRLASPEMGELIRFAARRLDQRDIVVG